MFDDPVSIKRVSIGVGDVSGGHLNGLNILGIDVHSVAGDPIPTCMLYVVTTFVAETLLERFPVVLFPDISEPCPFNCLARAWSASMMVLNPVPRWLM